MSPILPLKHNQSMLQIILDNIEITPQWLLDLGVRWDKFETDMKYNQDSGSGTTAIKAGTHYTSDNDFFNYQLGVTFKPAENGSIYLTDVTHQL